MHETQARRGVRRGAAVLLAMVLALSLGWQRTWADEGRQLIPVGKAVGIKLFADGVLVVSVSPVQGTEETRSPAKECGLKEGDILHFDPDKRSTDVLISKYLSDLLSLKLGDSFLTYFVGEEVRVRKFHISGIYETGFADYDKLFVFADIRQVRRLNGWDDDQVSGVELLVHDYDQLDQTAEDLYFERATRQDREGNSYYVRSIKDLNPMIFSWLDVLDINVVVILVLMLAVAGFTMISGLLIIILERTNMIGILKALGQNNRSIRKVFLYVSFFLIGKGMLWGNVIGIAICLLQSTTHILKLDPTIYYLDAVPIDLSLTSLILLNIGTLAISMLMMLGPSYLITQISPARSIRFE